MECIQYRHPTKSDAAAIADILNRSNTDFPRQRQVTAQEFCLHILEDTDYDPQGHWLAEVDSEAVGYGGGDVHKSQTDTRLNNGWVGVEVVPEHRGKGIEQQMMLFSLEYLGSRRIYAAQQQCMGTEGWRHDLARELGFRDVRHGYLMMWKKTKEPRVYQPPDGIHLEHRPIQEITDEELTIFVETYNDAFSEHYNFSPMTVQRLQRSKNTNERSARVTFAKDDSKTIGLCTYGARLSGRREENAKAGMVGLLGVSEPYRRKGIGRAMISHAMKWLSQEGMATICLSVDAENPHALDLYTSSGFETMREDIVYRKELANSENRAHMSQEDENTA
ncbi:MAG: GNAT family N-acetyltransferase [Theionarchaea archaeon]|nr:GNAT family N-acetyltransferase [Theionarchaea archaeon]MBU7001925.1 GNAT family N-acetyltransferase [Theionarchaea archaeon]MBU7020412.1 GNAT family N-acetyltransferase [Theionarchaea archaeon]